MHNTDVKQLHDDYNVVSLFIEVDGVPPWKIRAIIHDLRLFANEASLSFALVHRSANRVVDWMAKFVLSLRSSVNVNHVNPNLSDLICNFGSPAFSGFSLVKK